MATASDRALSTQRMEELLKCCICLKTLDEPRTLPCFHSFCKICLAKYVEIKREEARKKRKERYWFNCSTCRTHFRLREDESVEQLQSNHFINNMLDILKIQKQKQMPPCESCRAQVPAARRCIECERYLCGNCLTTHNNWSDFKDHVVMTLEELAKPENQAKARSKPRCLNHGHENKPLELYCNSYHELACMTCVLLGQSKADLHDYQPIIEVAEQHKEALKTTSDVLQQKSNECQSALEKIKHATQNLQANSKKVNEAILQKEREILEEFTKKLKRNTAVLLGQVDKKHKEVNQKLLKQHGDIKNYVEKVNGPLDLAKSIVENGSNEEILLIGNKIKITADIVEKKCPQMMQPIHNGDIEYIEKKSAESVVENINLNDLGNIESRPFRDVKKPRSARTFPQSQRSVIIDIETPFHGSPSQDSSSQYVQYLRERSTILDGNINHAKQLVEWLQDKMFGLRLCYWASRHGWEGSNFHKKCDNVGPTLILIKCGTNVFGGYTDQSWEARGTLCGYKSSNCSFLFSLRNKDNLPPFKCPIYACGYDHAIYCGPNCGPNFGSAADLFIREKAIEHDLSYSNLGETYQPPKGYQHGTPQTKALLAGSFEFKPTEIEGFAVIKS